MTVWREPSARAAVPGRNTRSHVLEQIRGRILRLDLPPGAPVSENELAAELGVSRTPVRESLILLVEERLVSVVPQVGTFVAPIRESEIATAQFVRESLELAALREAVQRTTREDNADLADLLAAQRRAKERGDNEMFFGLDDAFHCRLMEISGHGSVWRTVAQAKAHLDRARRLALPLDGRIEESVEEHQAVATAVEAGDVHAAVEALRHHLRGIFDNIGRIRAAHPEYFGDPERS